MGSKKKKSPPFLMIPKEMISSKPWLELKSSSIRAYVHIAAKYNGKNEKNLSLTYKEASKFMSIETYKAALADLVEKGFLNVERYGYPIASRS